MHEMISVLSGGPAGRPGWAKAIYQKATISSIRGDEELDPQIA
jgi:hypothetical protein